LGLKRLKAELTSWRKALEGMGAGGRRVLRSLLTGPVLVQREQDGSWAFEGHGSMGEVIKGWLGIHVPVEELEALEAENAAVTQLEPAEAQVHQQWCPRGDSNTRHAV
jgi:hypothetical protein